MRADQIAAHNARVYRARMAQFRHAMFLGSAYNDRAAPQLMDGKWDAAAERESRGTFVMDAATAALWQRSARREPVDQSPKI